VVVIRKAFGPSVGTGEGREFARHRDEIAEQPLGVDPLEPLEVAQYRLPAVEQLEQQVRGESLGPAFGPLDRTQRQFLLTAFEPPEDVDEARSASSMPKRRLGSAISIVSLARSGSAMSTASRSPMW
jgi:hypothetical protein